MGPANAPALKMDAYVANCLGRVDWELAVPNAAMPIGRMAPAVIPIQNCTKYNVVIVGMRKYVKGARHPSIMVEIRVRRVPNVSAASPKIGAAISLAR